MYQIELLGAAQAGNHLDEFTDLLRDCRKWRVDRLPAAARRHRDLLPGDSPLKIHSPMKHLRPIFSFLFPIFCFLLSLPVAAQSLSQDLARFAETPAVPGYEQALAAEIRAQMGKLLPRSDNLDRKSVV